MRVELNRKQRQVGSVAIVVALIAGLLIVVAHSDTRHVADMRLHDAGIWMTRTSDTSSPVGRLNTELASVDLTPAGADQLSNLDVVQSGEQAAVIASGASASSVAGISTANARLGPVQGMPGGSSPDVALGGDTGAALIRSTGKLWVTSSDRLGNISFSSKPDEKVRPQSIMTVGVDGVTHVYEPSGRFHSISAGGVDHVTSAPPTSESNAASLQITAVGPHAVVLDAAERRVIVDNGHSFRLGGGLATASGSVLQLPAASNDGVVIESVQDAELVPLDGSAPHQLTAAPSDSASQALVAVAPAFVGGCDYIAWRNANHAYQVCPSRQPEARTDWPIAPGSDFHDPIVWRVNHDRVVLNDTATGGGLLFSASGAPDQISPDAWSTAFKPADSQKATQPGSVDKECKGNDPPTAKNDTFGARANRVAELHVLANDNDPAGPTCHVLVVTAVSMISPKNGSLPTIGRGGQTILYSPPSGISTASMDYTVSNGVNSSQAQVVVNVFAPNVNTPAPYLTKGGDAGAPQVQKGTTATVNGLKNYVDPQGDPLSISAASVPPGENGVSVAYSADGTLHVSVAQDNALSQAVVHYVVSDDRGASVNASLTFAVGNAPVRPTALPDYGRGVLQSASRTVVPRDLVIDLLANDTPGSGKDLVVQDVRPMSLAQHPPFPGKVRPDRNGKLAIPLSGTPGAYMFQYTLSDGVSTAPGLVRVDLVAQGPNAPPEPTPDTVQLSAEHSALVDVLANDTDPDGDLLAVESAHVDGINPALARVIVVNRSLVRVDASPGTPAFSVTYTVTDGYANHEVDSSISVLPRPPNAPDQPPTALDDTATVRAGGVADISILDNDRDPDGDPLHIVDNSVRPANGRLHLIDSIEGRVYVHGSHLRYAAPAIAPATPVVLRYAIADPSNKQSSANVTITVLPAGSTVETAPEPPPLDIRVAENSSTGRVQIPLVGIDAENDSVSVIGLGAGAPRLGSLTSFHDHVFVYQAGDIGGTDSFRYLVRDALGEINTGTVVIAVVPPGPGDAPIAFDDAARARPGSTIAVPVLANDSFSDSGTPTIVDISRVASSAPGKVATAATNAQYVNVTIPTGAREDSQFSFSYALESSDGRRSATPANVVVTVDSRAPLDHPDAVDDVVSQPASKVRVTVPVLDNDSDPVYSKNDLTIDPDPLHRYVVDPDRKSITIDLAGMTGVSRTVMYTVHNHLHQSDAAFVTITPAAGAAPVAVTDYFSAKVPKVGVPAPFVSYDVLANDIVRPGAKKILANVWTNDGEARISKSGDRVEFRHSLTESGVASVVYELTDGSLTVSGLLVVNVVGNARPIIYDQLISVAPNSTTTIDLASPTVTKDDRGDHDTFAVKGTPPSGTTVSLSGSGHSSLTINAHANAARRTSSVLVVTATDASGATSKRAGFFTISVTDPPPPTVSDFSLGPFRQHDITGAIPVDVLAHTTVHVSGAPTVSVVSLTPSTAGSAQVAGNSLTLNVSKSFFGAAQLVYRVTDASGQSSTATATITVIDKPDKPSVAPSIVGNKFTVDPATNKVWLTLDWHTGLSKDRGSPVVDYEVNVTGPVTDTIDCHDATGICPINGSNSKLVPSSTAYTFTVTAIPADLGVGKSDPSDPATKALDVAPNAPASPTSDFLPKAGSSGFVAGHTLALSWAAPKQFGSPIDHWVVACSGPALANWSTTLPAAVLNTDVGGLTQGQQYSCSIQAVNQSGLKSADPPTPFTGNLIPIGPPSAVPQIDVSNLDSQYAPGGKDYDINFAAIAPTSRSDLATGGDDPGALVYTLQTTVNGVAHDWTGGKGATDDAGVIPIIDNAQYEFTLSIANSYTEGAHLPAVSGLPIPYTSLGHPNAQVTDVTTPSTPAYQSGKITIGSTGINTPPKGALQFHVVDAAGGLDGYYTAGDVSLSSPSVGDHTITVDACYVYNSGPSQQALCASQNGSPAFPIHVYVAGPAGGVTAFGGSNGRQPDGSSASVTWSWQAPASGDDGCNGCGIKGYLVYYGNPGAGDCNGWGFNSSPYRNTISASPGQTITKEFDVVAVNNASGAKADCTKAQGATVSLYNPPPPKPSVSPGAYHNISGQCDTSDCRYVTISMPNMSAPYHITMYEQWTPSCKGYGSNIGTRSWYSYTANSSPSNFVVYGHTYCNVWAVVNGQESNHLNWP